MKKEAQCPLCTGGSIHEMNGTDLMFGGEREYEYRKCVNCSASFQFPTPSLQEIAGFYRDGYGPHKSRTARKLGACHRAVLKTKYGYGDLDVPAWGMFLAPLLSLFRYRDSISAVPNGHAVDVGCGRGGLVSRLTELGWNAQGVEFDEGAAAVAQESGLSVFCGELSDAAFQENTFDLVTTQHVIEHLADPNAFLAEVARILKPGGTFYAKTPNALAFGRPSFGKFWFPNDVPRHLVLFSEQSLKELATRHGMDDVVVQNFAGPKAFLNSWDWRVSHKGKPSRHRPARRILGKLCALMARILGKGDELLLRCRLRG